MEDTEKGGLSSITPTSSFAQKLQAQTSESQQILDAHRKRLMDLMSSRKQMPFDPSMMALAAGLLAPTKTGGFGESLGYGMSGYAAEAEKQFRREQEEAKLAYELEVGAQQQKRELMGQQLMAEMFGGEEPAPVPQVAKAEVPPAAPPAAKVEAVAAPAEAPAEVPVEVVQSAQAQTAQAAKALDMPELALPAVPRNKIARMTDEQIAMLKSFNPSMGKILEEYRKAFRENRQLQISEVNLGRQLQELELAKRKDIREEKDIGFKERKLKVDEASIENSLPGVGNIKMPKSFWDELDSLSKSEDFNFEKLLNFYRSKNLPVNTTVDAETGKLRFMTENERNVKAKKDEARFTQTPIKRQIPEYSAGEFDITPVDYSDYLEARRKGPNALQHWFNGSQFSGVVIPGATIGTKLNSPELTNPPPVSDAAPKPETAEKPAAEPSVSKEVAPVPAPADKRVVVEAAPPSSGTAGTTTVLPKAGSGRVLSAQDLERQRREEQLNEEIRKRKEEERIVTEEAAKRDRTKEEVKIDVELGTNIMKEGTNAQNIRIIAKDLKSIATSNPKILDVMQDTDIKDSLARTISSGIITPWGSVSIDPKDLYVAVNNFADKNKDKIITKADRDAYSLFLRNIAQLTILERRMSRGEGAISDKETGLFQQVNVLPSDSALAVRLKAELIEERANVTEQVGDAFYKYKKKTGGSYEDFTHSSEFMDIKKGYEKKLDRIRDANAKLLGGVSAPTSQAVPQTAIPPEAVKKLKENVETPFKNGQVWTLKDGKPIRIR